MEYIKMQGTLNDFILIDEERVGILTDEERSRWAFILCHREMGIGADGVLYVTPSTKGDAMMRIFNADGSEALMCGNGLRCFGRYLMERQATHQVQVETLKAVYRVSCHEDFATELMGYRILLDNVVYYGPTAETEGFKTATGTQLDFVHLTVSNPHIVAYADGESILDQTLIPLGMRANTDKAIFSEGMNVNLVQVLDPNAIYVRTYERGVGITKSCGTGMTASVTRYAIDRGKKNQWIQVYNDGGMILCFVNETPEGFAVDFIGNATYMESGRILSTDKENLNYQVDQTFDAEGRAFEAFFRRNQMAVLSR